MECIICNEEINKRDTICLECGHLFHSQCIIQLVKKRTRKCPLCRNKIKWNVSQITRHYNLYISI